jgi:hypothetical protein
MHEVFLSYAREDLQRAEVTATREFLGRWERRGRGGEGLAAAITCSSPRQSAGRLTPMGPGGEAPKRGAFRHQDALKTLELGVVYP